VTPLGCETPLRVDVRFICASDRDLKEMAEPVNERARPGDRRLELGSLLKEHGWRIQSAANAMGVARSTLYRQMDRFHIIPPNRQES
jgi:transcriptional regulator of acetoin/glycerol metabolism